jgi:superfamily II DNA helicase RecQ
MGIGARKSILFILPASCLIGVTVVVIPLVLLRGNLIDYYNKVGIEYVK